MDDPLYDGHDELYHHAKFGEDRTTRTGCRCENVVFVCFLPAGLPRSAFRRLRFSSDADIVRLTNARIIIIIIIGNITRR